MATPRMNEGTAYSVRIITEDKDGADTTPSSLRYRVDCVTNNQTVVDWVTLTPATSVTITIDGATNRMIDTSRSVERKVITVEANAGLSTALTAEKFYEIKNMFGLD